MFKIKKKINFITFTCGIVNSIDSFSVVHAFILNTMYIFYISDTRLMINIESSLIFNIKIIRICYSQ